MAVASTGTIRAVNPHSLATVSSVTKIPGFATTPIPPVIRPNLLTGQLAGCHPQCQACNGTHTPGPAGNTGFAQSLASYIPPDYGHLRGLRAWWGGDYGIFKMMSSGEGPAVFPNVPPAPASSAAQPTATTTPSMGRLGQAFMDGSPDLSSDGGSNGGGGVPTISIGGGPPIVSGSPGAPTITIPPINIPTSHGPLLIGTPTYNPALYTPSFLTSTYAGLPMTTWLLIGLGVLVVLQVSKR